jgi:transcriptional regulator GlxA family with amidase domain
MPRPHNILLLAFPNGQLLDIAGPLQMFAGANDELSRPVYRIEIAAAEAGHFPTSSGDRLVADVAFAKVTNGRLARTDTLITVGGEPGMRQELARGSVTAIASRAICRVPRIASVCSGTFFLTAGALDGLRAATHWSEVDALRRFRPAVVVVERVRIDLARRRLLETDKNVETIAIACGFGSLRRMDRAFARLIASSPTEFQSRFMTNGGQACRSSTLALSFSQT